MRTAICKLKSATPYSQSRAMSSEKKNKESPADYDERCWREHCHADADGECFIPGICFMNAIQEAASRDPIKIPGAGNHLYKKHFISGIAVIEPVPLGVKSSDVEGESLFQSSNGKKDGGTRVWRKYPIFREWAGVINVAVFDDVIPEDIFAQYLESAGKFIGIGRWRPKNGGMNGRFEVLNIDWS